MLFESLFIVCLFMQSSYLYKSLASLSKSLPHYLPIYALPAAQTKATGNPNNKPTMPPIPAAAIVKVQVYFGFSRFSFSFFILYLGLNVPQSNIFSTLSKFFLKDVLQSFFVFLRLPGYLIVDRLFGGELCILLALFDRNSEIYTLLLLCLRIQGFRKCFCSIRRLLSAVGFSV